MHIRTEDGVVDIGQRPDNNHIPTPDGWVYSESRHWNNIRIKRNALLFETDSAALPDHPDHSLGLLDYRQALRDLPQSFDSPYEVVWPTNPLEV